MAQYEHLPLFQAVYDFKLYFVKLSRGFPKDFKYGLATEVRESCRCMLDNIINANNHQNKTAYLEEVASAIERTKIKMRLLKDLGVIKTSSYKFSFEALIGISKQTSAWRSWAKSAL